ncbi:hypothetical protein G6M26_26820 [Agrobacterium tumefaciens]|nr:hypothetical protein [Agrobacterium tumefaciens]NTE22167.1 hypothetical protein [Agrobacterium tumefaciens]
MFRKIHFRLADKRFLSELNDAFSPLWNRCLARVRSFMIHYPRSVFAIMILSIGLSLLVLARDFLGIKNKAVNAKPAGEVSGFMDLGATGFYQGLEEISGKAAKMKRNVELHQKVDTLLNKKHLTAQDSLWLLRTLESLER